MRVYTEVLGHKRLDADEQMSMCLAIREYHDTYTHIVQLKVVVK